MASAVLRDKTGENPLREELIKLPFFLPETALRKMYVQIHLRKAGIPNEIKYSGLLN